MKPIDPVEPPYNRLERIAGELGVREADVLRIIQFRLDEYGPPLVRVDIDGQGVKASYLSEHEGCYVQSIRGAQ